MSESALFDVAGPRTRRRIYLGSAIGSLIVLGLLGVAAWRLALNGEFAVEKWAPFVTRPALYGLLWSGLLNTLKAAAYGLVLALTLGVTLAVGRLSRRIWVRLPCEGIVEFLRSLPVLLLMIFFFIGFPMVFDIDLPALWSVVFALSLYNGAVICEIVRAGVLSLEKGQNEAAAAIGLRRGQALRQILLPQAVQRMLPALISQLVVLVKDSSLGFIVGFQELLSAGSDAQQLLRNPLQMFACVAAIFIVVNSGLSWTANYVERRQRSKYGTRAARSRAAQEAELG